MLIARPGISIVLAALLVSACSRDEGYPSPDLVSAPPVEAVAARFGGLPLVERLSGTVRAENQVQLYPEIAGRIAAVLVENGATVTVGQILIELDDTQAREQLRQAQAGRRIGEARVRQARAGLSELEAQARRLRTLGDQELISQSELDTIAAQLESAAADVALAEAQLEQAESTMAAQQDLLTKTMVRAPISGIVGLRNAEVGMQVSPSTQLFTIGNLDRVTVSIQLTDSMLHYIAAGQSVRIPVGDTEEARMLTAELTRISPFLNEVSRSARAEIELDNPNRELRPGMFVPVDILYGESTQATLVPSSALFTHPDSGRPGVFVLSRPPPAAGEPPGSSLSDPLPVEFRPVPVLARGAMEIAIGLVEPGEWVVTIGHDLLATGRTEARVRAVTWDHVMTLQGMKREDLLEAVLRPKEPEVLPNS